MSASTVSRPPQPPKDPTASFPELAEHLKILGALCRGFRLSHGHQGVTAILCDRMEEELDELSIFPVILADLEHERTAPPREERPSATGTRRVIPFRQPRPTVG